MRRWMILATVLVLLLSLSAIALAQETPPGGTVPLPPIAPATDDATDDDNEEVVATATPIPVATEVAPKEVITDTASVTPTAATAVPTVVPNHPYMTIELSGGFALDPFFVSLNGGGPVDASTLDPGCTGWISERPVVQLNWSGHADFAEIFVYSDHNPSLVIQAPDGSYFCNNDTNDLLQDPTIEVTAPVTGTYNIWVGNIDNRGLIPGVLVLTSRAEVNTGTFDLSNLVKRPAIREQVLDALDVVPGAAEVQQKIQAALASFDEADIVVDADTTVTFTQAISGGVPGFIFPTAVDSPFSVCNGIVNPDNATFFTLAEEVEGLNIFAESDADTTLILVGSDGLAYCTDESQDDTNRNPQLRLEDLPPGNYALGVGDVGPEGPSEAVVTISTDMSLSPVMHASDETGGSE